MTIFIFVYYQDNWKITHNEHQQSKRKFSKDQSINVHNIWKKLLTKHCTLGSPLYPVTTSEDVFTEGSSE